MNELIRELAEQAGYTKDMFGVGHWDMPECKKFAELIILECANMCLINDPGDATYFGQQAAEKYIKQHFGVEE